jgi:5-methylcytosine-specific restriction endonuclease McrA
MSAGKKSPPQGLRTRPETNARRTQKQSPRAGVAQPKMASTTQFKAGAAAAPPVYRPQPVPKVLQAKTKDAPRPAGQPSRAPAAPAVYRPQPVPKVLQPKMSPAAQTGAGQTPRSPAAPAVYRPEAKKIVQPKMASAASSRKAPAAPPVYKPEAKKIVQPKMGVATHQRPGPFAAPAGCAAPHAHGSACRHTPAQGARGLAGSMLQRPAAPTPPRALQAKQLTPTLIQRPAAPNALQLKADPRHASPSAYAHGPNGGVIQRTLLRYRVTAIETALSTLMDETFDDGTPEYTRADRLFNRITAETHDHDAQQQLLAAAVATGRAEFAQIAATIDIGSVRRNYYPSTYSATALQHKNTYVANNPGGTPGTWRCPGTGTVARPAHDVSTADVTIDHVIPVATHWNTVGYKSNKATRVAWYSDHTNHVYLCQSCNSSKGSGGVHYTKEPDIFNGFSA